MSENGSINWLGNKVMESNPQKTQPNMRDRTYIPAAPMPAAAQSNMPPMPNIPNSPVPKSMVNPMQTNPTQKSMTSPAGMNKQMPEMNMDMNMDMNMGMSKNMDMGMGKNMDMHMGKEMDMRMGKEMDMRMGKEMGMDMEMDEMPAQMGRMPAQSERNQTQTERMQGPGMTQQAVPPPLRPGAFQDGPPPVMNRLYIPGYLESLIGSTIRAEFVIGTNQSTDRVGRLIDVGVNYFVLEDLLSRNLIMCDLYSVKFVTVMR